jgi:hypothetical protein
MSLWDKVRGMIGLPASDAQSGANIADPAIRAIVQKSDANKPQLYREQIQRALAYLRGQAQVYVLISLRQQFPKTAEFMQPLQLGLYTRLMTERSRTFAGDGQKFELLRDGKPVEEAGGVKWQTVLDDAKLIQKLIEIDRHADAARSYFIRVLWNEKKKCVLLTLFSPDRVNLPLSPDVRDVEDCEEIALELAPIRDPQTTASGNGSTAREKRRFEHWTAAEENPWYRIVDDDGEVIDEGENPYADDEGNPVIPLVRFSTVDPDAGAWQLPDEALLGGAEAVDAQYTNMWHVTKLGAYGQWKGQRQANVQADEWPGQVDRGPETIMIAPNGWDLEHVAQSAPITEIGTGVADFMKQLSALAALPPGTVVQEGSRNIASGAALLIERAPLDELRRDRILAYDCAVERLLELIRIVWNYHQPDASTQFLKCKPEWTPGDVQPPVDQIGQAQIDAAKIKNGTWSPVRSLMRDESLSREDAKTRAAEIAEENRAGVAANMRDVSGSLFPPRQPAPDAQAPKRPDVPVPPAPADVPKG